MNGTVHFSVLDGWWVEGYKRDSGWALPLDRTYDVQDFQDELDAEAIYDIFEDEVIPTYYSRNKEGIPEKWVNIVKNTIAQVAPNFTTSRMIRDYQVRFYGPLAERTAKLKANNYALVHELAAWKNKVMLSWNEIEVKNIQITDGITNVLRIGEEYPAKVVLDLKGLSPDDIGLEMVIAEPNNDGSQDLVECIEFKIDTCDGTNCTYLLNLHLMNPGAYNYGLRLYPKNPNLPNRQDFKYIRWI